MVPDFFFYFALVIIVLFNYNLILHSGLAAVAKVLIAMEEGAIPSNLHYKTPNPDVPGLADGRLSVVVEKTSWNGGYVGINSFGFGGSNVHAVLKSNQTSKPGTITAVFCLRRLAPIKEK